MKKLIVYYSLTHNNELLAETLQQKLHCDMLKIEDVNKRSGLTTLLDVIFYRKPKIKKPDVSVITYSQCILVAPVWAGRIASPLRSFLVQEKFNINRYSFISVCGGYKGQEQKILKELTNLLGMPPAAFAELWINDLLPEKKKNTIKYTSGYRIGESDIVHFNADIDNFLNGLEVSDVVASSSGKQ